MIGPLCIEIVVTVTCTCSCSMARTQCSIYTEVSYHEHYVCPQSTCMLVLTTGPLPRSHMMVLPNVSPMCVCKVLSNLYIYPLRMSLHKQN